MSERKTLQTNDPLSVSTIARYRLALVRENTVRYRDPPLCNQQDLAVGFLHRLLASYDREVVGVILLNSCHKAIGHCIAYIGTLNSANVEPRGLLVPALLANAAGIILFHNHPSGDPTPSADDIALTRRIAEAGELLGIHLLDHLILGEAPCFASLLRQGVITQQT